MRFERGQYIEKLISCKHNHLIKIVTGLRRVGKSYLLFNLYKQRLLSDGVAEDHIIEFQLDSFAHRKFRKAETLYEYYRFAGFLFQFHTGIAGNAVHAMWRRHCAAEGQVSWRHKRNVCGIWV